MTQKEKEQHFQFEKWAREQRERIKEERSMQAPLFKRL